MALDQTPIVAAEMQIARLDLPDDAELIFGYNDDGAGWTELFILDQSGAVDWDAVNVDNLAVAKDFFRVRIIDFEGLSDNLDTAEAVKYDGHIFKISRVDPPFGVVRVWTLRLERVGRE